MCIGALREFPLLDMVGLALRAGGKIIGYTIGETVGDMFLSILKRPIPNIKAHIKCFLTHS